MRVASVIGFSGYAVDSNGGVWSYWKPGGRGKQWTISSTRRKLRPYRNGRYLEARLKRNGKTYYRLVHILVLNAFRGPCPPGKQTRHIDGNGINNKVANLKYGTAKQNAEDRERHGNTLRGARNGASKLTELEAIEVLTLCRRGVAYKAVGRRFNITGQMAKLIHVGKKWKHLHRKAGSSANI